MIQMNKDILLNVILNIQKNYTIHIIAIHYYQINKLLNMTNYQNINNHNYNYLILNKMKELKN